MKAALVSTRAPRFQSESRGKRRSPGQEAQRSGRLLVSGALLPWSTVWQFLKQLQGPRVLSVRVLVQALQDQAPALVCGVNSGQSPSRFSGVLPAILMTVSAY